MRVGAVLGIEHGAERHHRTQVVGAEEERQLRHLLDADAVLAGKASAERDAGLKDLPARREAWRDTALTGDSRARAFGQQLERVAATPMVPEWELIASRLQDHAERVIRGTTTPEAALASLDREVDVLLEKRRWLLSLARSGKPVAAGVER